MAYRRRRRIRRSRRPRRSQRRSRFGRRKFKRSRKYAGNAIHYLKRISLSRSLSTNTTFPLSAGSMFFQLNDINTIGEFTGVYDSYRIMGIQLKFLPPATVSTVQQQDLGTFMYFTDYDDSGVPNVLSEFEQRPDCQYRQVSTSRPWKVFIRPKTSTTIANAAGQQTSGVQEYGKWLDMVDITIPYYGFKWGWLANQTPASSTSMRVVSTYYIQFRGIR